MFAQISNNRILILEATLDTSSVDVQTKLEREDPHLAIFSCLTRAGTHDLGRLPAPYVHTRIIVYADTFTQRL